MFLSGAFAPLFCFCSISILFNSTMKHLEEVGETYWQHLKVGMGVVSTLALATHGQLLHALIPCIKPPLDTDLKSIISFLEKRLPENRTNKNVDEDLYTVYGGD